MNPQRLFFMGGGHGGLCALASLQNAFDSVDIISEDHETLAKSRGTDRSFSRIEESTARYGVMAGHTGILSPDIIANRTILNVHYSLLPKYRGLHSVVWAMLNLENELGLTVHLVNQDIDDGPVIYQHRVQYENQTSWELMGIFNEHVRLQLGSVIRQFLEGRIKPIDQDKSQATWVPKRGMDDCFIDFSWPMSRLRAIFKALVRPYPLPAIKIRGQRFEVTAASFIERGYFCQNGRVVNVDGEGAWIKCADGLLVIRELMNDRGTRESAAARLRFGMRL